MRDSIVQPLVAIEKVGELLKDASGREISIQQATLGNVSYFLKSVERTIKYGNWIKNEISELFPNIRKLEILALADDIDRIAREYRNSWVHDKAMPKSIFEKFRFEAPRLFMKWNEKWRRGNK